MATPLQAFLQYCDAHRIAPHPGIAACLHSIPPAHVRVREDEVAHAAIATADDVTLDMSGCQVTPRDLEATAAALGVLNDALSSRVRVVSVLPGGTTVNVSAPGRILWNLSNVLLRSHSAQMVADIVTRTPQLSHIIMHGCALKDASAAGIIRAAATPASGSQPAFRGVHTLDFSSNGIEGQSVAVLTEWIASTQCTVSRLSLDNTRLGDVLVARLGDALAYNTSIRTVCLRRCGFGLRGGQALARALSKNRVLLHIHLEYNTVQSAVAADIAAALNRNRQEFVNAVGEALRGADAAVSPDAAMLQQYVQAWDYPPAPARPVADTKRAEAEFVVPVPDSAPAPTSPIVVLDHETLPPGVTLFVSRDATREPASDALPAGDNAHAPRPSGDGDELAAVPVEGSTETLMARVPERTLKPSPQRATAASPQRTTPLACSRAQSHGSFVRAAHRPADENFSDTDADERLRSITPSGRGAFGFVDTAVAASARRRTKARPAATPTPLRAGVTSITSQPDTRTSGSSLNTQRLASERVDIAPVWRDTASSRARSRSRERAAAPDALATRPQTGRTNSSFVSNITKHATADVAARTYTDVNRPEAQDTFPIANFARVSLRGGGLFGVSEGASVHIPPAFALPRSPKPAALSPPAKSLLDAHTLLSQAAAWQAQLHHDNSISARAMDAHHASRTSTNTRAAASLPILQAHGGVPEPAPTLASATVVVDLSYRTSAGLDTRAAGLTAPALSAVSSGPSSALLAQRGIGETAALAESIFSAAPRLDDPGSLAASIASATSAAARVARSHAGLSSPLDTVGPRLSSRAAPPALGMAASRTAVAHWTHGIAARTTASKAALGGLDAAAHPQPSLPRKGATLHVGEA